MNDGKSAYGLGLVSVAIGAAEICCPEKIQQMMGIESDAENKGIFRVLGVREIMHGVDLLTHRNATPGVWARLAGDVLDNALIAAAATTTKRPAGLAAVAAMVMPVVLADVKKAFTGGGGSKIERKLAHERKQLSRELEKERERRLKYERELREQRELEIRRRNELEARRQLELAEKERELRYAARETEARAGNGWRAACASAFGR